MQLDAMIAGTLRTATALLFAAGLTHKLWDLDGFRRTVESYLRGFSLSDSRLEVPASAFVVAVEFAVVVSCMVPGGQYLAAALSSGLLLLYAAAMSVNLLRGNDLPDCGCNWGSRPQPVRPALVVRNVILAALALTIGLPVLPRELSAVDIASIVLATINVALLYTAANHLLMLETPVWSKKS